MRDGGDDGQMATGGDDADPERCLTRKWVGCESPFHFSCFAFLGSSSLVEMGRRRYLPPPLSAPSTGVMTGRR